MVGCGVDRCEEKDRRVWGVWERQGEMWGGVLG